MQIQTHENSTIFINLPLKWSFQSFPSFLTFRIDSIAQNENLETPVIKKKKKISIFFFKLWKTLPNHDIYVTLRIWIPHKPKKPYFSQTIPPSDIHCFLLKNSLDRCNVLEIFHLNTSLDPWRQNPIL